MNTLLIRFAVWLESKARDFREYVDRCYICREDADLWCVGCGERHCYEHTSGFYNDEDLCEVCRLKITPEDEAAMIAESIDDDEEFTLP